MYFSFRIGGDTIRWRDEYERFLALAPDERESALNVKTKAAKLKAEERERNDKIGVWVAVVVIGLLILALAHLLPGPDTSKMTDGEYERYEESNRAFEGRDPWGR